MGFTPHGFYPPWVLPPCGDRPHIFAAESAEPHQSILGFFSLNIQKIASGKLQSPQGFTIQVIFLTEKI
jgi:hypothetical protein